MNELWRRTRWLVVFLLGYGLLFGLLVVVSPDHGLVTPDGHLHVASALLTGAVLIGRLIAWFVIVPLLLYRIVVVSVR